MTQPQLFDRDLIRRRRLRAARLGVPGAGFLLDRVVGDMAERLSLITRRFEVGLAVGSGAAALATMLAASGKVGGVGDLLCHEDALPFAPASVDLIVSALSLQAIDDLPGALIQMRRCLRPDGLLMAALPGGDTLTELRDSLAAAEVEITGGLSPRVIPFLDVRDMGGLLQRAGLALPVMDADRLTVRYGSMFDLIRDLRAMGATNPLVERSRRIDSRRLFLRAADVYASRFADADGRVRATVQIISASGWSPAESQPKPLKPGSATMRLADALGTHERPVRATGEESA